MLGNPRYSLCSMMKIVSDSAPVTKTMNGVLMMKQTPFSKFFSLPLCLIGGDRNGTIGVPLRVELHFDGGVFILAQAYDYQPAEHCWS